jgi:c-di-GMP-binding flagellar brake protein YcgR
MPEGAMQERRRVERSMVSVPLRMFGTDERLLLRARTVDLSPHGALLHGGVSIAVGQVVDVEVVRGTEKNPLRLKAEVVRISAPDERRRQHRVALRFCDVSDLDAAILSSIIEDAQS